MGWLYPYHTTTKKMLVDYVMDSWKRCEATIHATKCVSQGMWILFSPKGDETKFIGFYLMKKADGLWGYKDMEEASGPYYYDCPREWLAAAPVQSQNWRAGVMKYYTDREMLKAARKSLQVGKTYNVGGEWRSGGVHIKQVMVESLRPLRGYAIATGLAFRIPRKMAAVMTEAV